jgi:hypothetical protein
MTESNPAVVLTGPISGILTLDDGTQYNVGPAVVEVDSEEHAAELADKIGRHWAENGHPDDVEEDPETGKLVQRPFKYDSKNYKKGSK